MISYEVYKILHLFTLMMLMSATGIVIGEGRWIPNKHFKICLGFLSLLVFVGGMGLIARLQFKHGEPFPLWIWIKIIAWILLNAILVAIFRMQSKKAKVGLGLIAAGVVFTAVIAAITKLA